MDEQPFRKIVERHLLPLFADAEIARVIPSNHVHQIASSSPDPREYFVKPTRDATWRLAIRRPEAFSTDERNLFHTFMSAFESTHDLLTSEFADEVSAALSVRVVANTVMPLYPLELQRIIAGLIEWSSQTYEGSPISFAVGIDPSSPSSALPVASLWKLDALKVMADGLDSIAVCDRNGNFSSVDALPILLDGKNEKSPAFAPYIFRRAANWANNGRVAAVLTRNREILLFGNGRLQFAWRRASWHFLSHQRLITRMGGLGNHGVRDAIYATALDVSFSRAGGCIGLCISKHMKAAFAQGAVLPPKDALAGSAEEDKVKAIRAMVQGINFQDIPRPVRRQLVSIDGATVVSPSGKVLCAGTIVAVTKGSEAGSRLAAAIAVSKLGLGIKISSDGPISAFRGGKRLPIFKVL